MSQIVITTPVMTREKFAEVSGMREPAVRGQMERDHIPTKKIGKLAMVNLVKLTQMCMEDGNAQASGNQ